MLINRNDGSLLAVIFFRIVAVIVVLSIAHSAAADSLVGEIADQGQLQANIHMSLDTLSESLPIDQDGDGQITKNELNSSIRLVAENLKSKILINRANRPCALMVLSNWSFTRIDEIDSLIIPVEYQCSAQGNIQISYGLARSIDVKLTSGEITIIKELSSNEGFVSFDLFEQKSTFLFFVREGFVHILNGYDHILFLVTLLLVAVLVKDNKRWVVSYNVADILKHTLMLVTAFTLSHSLTLGLTVFGLITLKSHIVEALIALTLVLSAINNIFPFMNRVVQIVFVFGLVHGLGFAGALSELDFTKNQQAMSLFAFNLGIELGQLLIVAFLLPLLLYFRLFVWYSRYFVRYFSLVIGCFALGLLLVRL